MTHRQFLPPGIQSEEWDQLSPIARVLVEAGMYLTAAELLPRQLYIEHLLSKVDPEDNRRAVDLHGDREVPRMQLKLFLQFLQRSTALAYTRRVIAVAEARSMQLSLDEDDASLYLQGLSDEERRELYRS